MQPNRIQHNGTIGMFCASHVGDMGRYAPDIAAMERLGFRVKLGANFCGDTYGYAASAEERAADLNALVADDDVQMVLFGGGESGVEVLPLIDYGNIRRHPKIFSSFSDGTAILNAIYAQTGLVTYYGAFPGEFADLRYYDYRQFCSHFVEGYGAAEFEKDSEWITLCGGSCEGVLIGGYLSQFGLLLSNKHFRYDENKKYLLFLEDHEKFSDIGAVSSCLASIGQSAFMRNVTGLLFGCYSKKAPEDLLRALTRFGERHGIPVVYTADFGHGSRHAVLPIGINAGLDADSQSMVFHGIR